MADILIKSLCALFVIAGHVVMYVFPFIYVLRKGKFCKGWGLCWCYQLLCALLLSIFVPALQAYIFPDHKDLIYDLYPEGNSVVAAMVAGWIPAFVVCGIAQLIYRARSRKNLL